MKKEHQPFFDFFMATTEPGKKEYYNVDVIPDPIERAPSERFRSIDRVAATCAGKDTQQQDCYRGVK